MTTIPARPFSFFEPDETSSSQHHPAMESDAKRLKRTNPITLDLTSINNDLKKLDEMRTRSTDLALQLKLETIHARRKLVSGTYNPKEDETHFHPILEHIRKHYRSIDDPTTTTSTTTSTLSFDTANGGPTMIEGGKDFQLSNRIEDYARFKAFSQFLSTGTLISPQDFSIIHSSTSTTTSASWISILSEEEYLAGAVMGLTDELSRYVLGRAIVRDMTSVTLAKRMVERILDYLLSFDFRNGYLRRKYDGVKYALKSCETVLYELSLTSGATVDIQDKTTLQPTNTTAEAPNGASPTSITTTTVGSILPMESLVDLRKRIEHKDNVRESLIKQCRDAQKFAKQGIFASHRGDYSRAGKYIHDCETMIQNILLPMTLEDPSLRWGGSLSSVFEEYMEAKLFFIWLQGKELVSTTADISGNPILQSVTPSSCGYILHPHEFPFPVRSEEYLGALCDLTGEIGRYAVQRGTARDTLGVSTCLETCTNILNAMESLHRYPYGFGKKMEQLKRNVEKLERMLYELSLIQATGRKIEPKDFSTGDMDDDKYRSNGPGDYPNND